jgi:SHS2 domain-containing protein
MDGSYRLSERRSLVMKKYRIFPHTADLGLEIYGASRRDLFAHAAFAVYDLITDLDKVEGKESRTIFIEGEDQEDLLINYLREILYLYNGERWFVKDVRIDEMDSRRMKVSLSGEPLDLDKHTIKKEIKAVTYHQVKVEEVKNGWKAKVIFDV